MIDFYVVYNPRSKTRDCYVGLGADFRARFGQHCAIGSAGGGATSVWMARQSELRVRLVARRDIPRSAARAVEMAIFDRLRRRGWALIQQRPLRPPSQPVREKTATVMDWVRAELRKDPALRRSVERRLERLRRQA